jgi:hypothetical protein
MPTDLIVLDPTESTQIGPLAEIVDRASEFTEVAGAKTVLLVEDDEGGAGVRPVHVGDRWL